MPHVVFNPDEVDWHAYFQRQCQQTGAGADGPFFAGSMYQRGAGIGSVFGKLLRFLVPLFKAAGAEIGREGLAVGSRVLGSVAEGQLLKDAAVNELSTGAQNVLKRYDLNKEAARIVDKGKALLQKGRGRQIHASRKAKQRPGRSLVTDALRDYPR